MKKTVFYSWQSDLSGATNRNLIESALKEAAKQIASDDSVDVDPVIDRDTQGSAGAPDISTTIFKKISDSDLFVADISFVAKSKKRFLPNPNVLIELGYALNAKGHEALILVFNLAYGKLESLPFDLKMRRVLTYTAKEEDTERSQTKVELIKDFKAAMIAGFSNQKPVVPPTPIVEIIEQNPANKIILLRKHLSEVLQKLDALQPIMHRDGGTVENLIKAISKTEDIACSFAKLSETVALMNDSVAAKEIFQWFGKILQRYDPPVNEAGRGSNADGDFFKFVGHELFVLFVAPFFKEGKWDILKDNLKEDLRIEPTRHRHSVTNQSWSGLSEYIPLLADESRKRNRKSLHDDLLKDRHVGNKPLADLSNHREFMDIDFLLHIGKTDWYPRSAIFLSHVPSFVHEAKNRKYAVNLYHTLNLKSLDELKDRLNLSKSDITYDWHSPFYGNEVSEIGTEGLAQIFG